MKSKYKLKIKEISMRLKSSLFLLLGVVCLLALGQMVQAEPWTDPTCAAPNCNTDGPIWVNPEDAQNASATSGKPMIYIDDTRTSSTPFATAYVRSALDGKPAISGYGNGATDTSYGGLFDASFAPGLKVLGGVVIASLADDPSYDEAGLLYLNSGTYPNQFRYYSGGWRTLNPFVSDGNELYYSLAAGTARGVAIKNGDLTGPNDDYTLDVYRKTFSNVDNNERALYARLASYSDDNYYASGSLGAYVDDGSAPIAGVVGKNNILANNMYGVYGTASGMGAYTNYGGYFTAAGNTGRGVAGIASGSGAVTNYGGWFRADGNSGRGVFGYAGTTGAVTNYGGYFQAAGETGVGVYGAATDTNTGVSSGGYFVSYSDKGRGVYGYAASTGDDNHWGGYFDSAGANGTGVYGRATGTTGVGVWATGPGTTGGVALRVQNGSIALAKSATIPTLTLGYGKLYIDSAEPKKIYFLDEEGQAHDLTAGSDASGNIADGTVTGQMTHWNDSALPDGQWQPVANTDMLWDNTNKNLGIGTGSPFSDNKLHVVKSASSGNPVGIYASTTLSSVGGNGYGAYVTATHSGTGGNMYGVYSTATGNGAVFGGRFSATGGAISYGISANGTDYGGYFNSSGDGGNGVYGYSSHSTNSYGGYFEADGESTSNSAGVRAFGVSKGVWGSATGADGTTAYGGYFTSSCSGNNCVGVYGQTASAADAGVKGVSTATGAADNGYGGYFTTAAGAGSGVRGIASYSTAGTTNYGGYFSAAGSTGRGVYGSATGTAAAYGGYFSASGSGNTGAAVYGVNSSTTGLNYGGYFTNASVTDYAAGVYGSNTASGDYTTYGGYFVTNAVNNGAAGVYGTTGVLASAGVRGVSSSTGTGTGYGGYFTAASTTGRAVYGEATGTGANYGGYFYSSSNTGTGVYGLATGSTGRAIEGYASYATGTNYGGYFQADGSTGRGVYSTVSGSGSTAVYGTSSGTGTAYGGFFSVTGASNTGSAVYAGNSSANGYAGYFGGRAYFSSNVGIGTLSPAQKLHIETSGSGNAIRLPFRISNLNTFSSGSTALGVGAEFELEDAGSNMVVAGSLEYGWTDATAGSTDTKVTFKGNVNGTSSTLMVINGIVYNTTVGATNRDLYIDNTGIIGYLSSSKRYKDNIQDMEDISWLYELRPVNFTYKNDGGKAKQYGLIAEEVEEVNPFFVSYDEEGLPETVSYSALVTPLLEAVQTQKQQLDALETKVEMIEKNGCANNETVLMETIEKLEARIEALEAQQQAPVKTSFWSKLW
jgi:hypothetical protein